MTGGWLYSIEIKARAGAPATDMPLYEDCVRLVLGVDSRYVLLGVLSYVLHVQFDS